MKISKPFIHNNVAYRYSQTQNHRSLAKKGAWILLKNYPLKLENG